LVDLEVLVGAEVSGNLGQCTRQALGFFGGEMIEEQGSHILDVQRRDRFKLPSADSDGDTMMA
jgi:hypothetical protein